ncbi:DUF2069 domain-containing protein [Solimonas marina]|uniref:DUF2069 domain-containing protein n=1 Tax=Solimonas marina TaxID=2714601 RepID=A0A969WE03_9GAMM|nr:DUF2069 domain-containing protein [Solimonas marina]NKF23641.1 DUF2069 domain-containing protein [Solimonas marina]
MTTPPSPTPTPVRLMRGLVMAAHLALIALLIGTARSSIGVVAGLLLFAPLPGLLRGSRYVHAWASMLLVVYCALLLAGGYSDIADRLRLFGFAALAAFDFCAMVMYVRVSAAAARRVRGS